MATAYLQFHSVASAAAGPSSGMHGASNPSAENKGDINGDGQVDILDVQLCVNVILGTEKDPAIVGRADVNQDGDVNILDIQATVNIFLAPPATQPPSTTATAPPTSTWTPSAIYTQNPTSISQPTTTPVPPTFTPEPSTATYTPKPPTPTPTNTPNLALTSTPTATPIPPTHTPAPSATHTPLPSTPTSPPTAAPTGTPGGGPYPWSTYITGLTWAPGSTIIRRASGSDNWPVTWADDGSLYSTYGDGRGFEPNVPEKLSLGFVRIDGSPTDFIGVNIYPSDGQQWGGGASGKKGYGLLMVDGTLYMSMSNADNSGRGCQLGFSSNYAVNWTFATWTFEEFASCAFINFGQNYAGARDNFVYLVSQAGNHAYSVDDGFWMARVPKNQIMVKTSWEYFSGMNGSNPTWSGTITDRVQVADYAGNACRSGITYNAPLGRYIWWQQAASTQSQCDTRFSGGFRLIEAPEPWGPWSVFYETSNWDVGPGERAEFPTKWMSADGKTMYLVFSGNDYFSVRKATLTVEG